MVFNAYAADANNRVDKHWEKTHQSAYYGVLYRTVLIQMTMSGPKTITGIAWDATRYGATTFSNSGDLASAYPTTVAKTNALKKSNRDLEKCNRQMSRDYSGLPGL